MLVSWACTMADCILFLYQARTCIYRYDKVTICIVLTSWPQSMPAESAMALVTKHTHMYWNHSHLSVIPITAQLQTTAKITHWFAWVMYCTVCTHRMYSYSRCFTDHFIFSCSSFLSMLFRLCFRLILFLSFLWSLNQPDLFSGHTPFAAASQANPQSLKV